MHGSIKILGQMLEPRYNGPSKVQLVVCTDDGCEEHVQEVAVREWESKLAPLLSEALHKRRHSKVGKSWYVDETYVHIQGRWWYLYRAIDRDGHLVDARLSDTRDLEAAE